MVVIPAGVKSEYDCAGEDPAAVVTYRHIFSSEGMLHKDYNRKRLVKKMLVLSLKGLVARVN
jgi:hypothetical protein